MKIFYSIFLIGLANGLFAQRAEPNFTGEFSVLTENDIFFFRDYYYSAGQDLILKKLLSANSTVYKCLSPNDTSTIILTYGLGIKIYTPREINQTEISKMDRPYAGYDYLSIGFNRFNKSNCGFSLKFNAGLVGSKTGLGQFQAWWHKTLQLRSPTGWSKQISNEVVINISTNYWHSWKIRKSVDLVSSTLLTVGTASNKLSEDVTFRFLKFKSLKYSNFTGSILLTNQKSDPEFFFFGGFGVDVVASNIFIEGSLFDKKTSPFVLDAIPFLFTQKFGFMYSTFKWSFSSTAHHLSKEVIGGIDHYYGSIDIGFRF